MKIETTDFIEITAEQGFELVNGDTVTNREWWVVYEGGSLKISLHNLLDSSTWIRRNFIFTPIINQWYHFVFTYDGSSSINGLKIFSDKINVGTAIISGNPYVKMTASTNNVAIGKIESITSYTLNGMIDGLAIWNKRLSISEINSIYNKQMVDKLELL